MDRPWTNLYRWHCLTLLLVHIYIPLFTHLFLFPFCLHIYFHPSSTLCPHSPLSHSQVETPVLHLRSHFPSHFSSVQTRPMLSTLITRNYFTQWSYRSLAAPNIGQEEEGQGKVNGSFHLLSNMCYQGEVYLSSCWALVHVVTNLITISTIYSLYI